MSFRSERRAQRERRVGLVRGGRALREASGFSVEHPVPVKGATAWSRVEWDDADGEPVARGAWSERPKRRGAMLFASPFGWLVKSKAGTVATALTVLALASAAAWTVLPEEIRESIANAVSRQWGEGASVIGDGVAIIRSWLGDDATALEPAAVLELRLSESARIHGFLRGTDLAPGDRVTGTALLTTTSVTDPERYRLGLAASIDRGDGSAVQLLSVRYADHEWMPSLRALDANADGNVTLLELSAGWYDLAPPTVEGSPLEITVRFMPPAGIDPNEYQGHVVGVSFVFTLLEIAEATP